jgi:hypothetical protein
LPHDYRVVYPFVCQSLWFYLSIRKFYHVQYVCRFNFCFPRSTHSPFWRSKCVHIPKALVVSIGIVPTLLGSGIRRLLFVQNISRIRCVLSRILHLL